ncbi:ATP-binding protein [Melaminivora suipulveris]|uniref:ATP-binding protein n=1 Tax=Melaminivora suipulveris TaxID=2109913 RepID=A0A2R3QCY2_9BURK|nr:ATP-binding protein [Melaminivora suipulveris]AVO49517.1 ATP-binding protein [Melaminivora suipulveris]
MTAQQPPGHRSGAFRARRLADLAQVQAQMGALAADAGLHADERFALRLALEEAFVNVYKHGYGGGEGPLTVELDVGAGQVTLTLEDQAPPFDPATVAQPVLDAAWDQRPVGGLGWHLIRQLMDRVEHRRGPAGGNLLILTKTLGAPGTGHPSEIGALR